MQDHSTKEISKTEISDLLKVKQYEKPDSEFWDKFQKELHQKSWQTLAVQDPWYVRLGKGLLQGIQPAIPLSATALILFGIVINQQTMNLADSENTPAEFIEEQIIITQQPDIAQPAQESVSSRAFEANQPTAEASFVVGVFSAQSASDSEVMRVAVAKRMPSIHSNNVRYVAGDFKDSALTSSSAPLSASRSLY